MSTCKEEDNGRRLINCAVAVVGVIGNCKFIDSVTIISQMMAIIWGILPWIYAMTWFQGTYSFAVLRVGRHKPIIAGR